jgi:hypothetical protein
VGKQPLLGPLSPQSSGDEPQGEGEEKQPGRGAGDYSTPFAFHSFNAANVFST